MATTEHTINDALAEVLIDTRSLWRLKGAVRSENIDILKGSTKRQDILITETNVSPVVVETEIMPAATVEADALQRLGAQIIPSGRRILSSLAVRLPARLRDYSGPSLKKEVSSAADLEVALFTGENPESYTRWPRAGWVKGNAVDLSILIQSASVPPAVVEEAANRLVSGVSEAAALLNEMSVAHPGAIKKICEELRQEDGEQTRRMTTTILANALVFHESLARGQEELYEVRTLGELKMGRAGLNKTDMLEDWQRILKVNYWPIFDIARRILEVIPADAARDVLERLVATATELVANHLMRSHDLTGAVFQRLIADRKFLAAYYTTPAAAALLVGLTIRTDRTPGYGEWAKAEDIVKLRIADFSCGTGTLLSTAYRRISQLHEAAGGDAELIHPAMMANALVGCDVLPAAAHLTASMLASAHPTIKYRGSSIMSVAYGPRDGGGVALGSLDLLDPQRAFEIVAITAKIVGGMGETEQETWTALPHESFDVVIMNPPFTRATDHSGEKSGIPNPMFGAFKSDKAEQQEMSEATERLFRGTAAHGNAGEGSYFLVLANKKLRFGGTLGLVLPLSLISGDAWEECRKLIQKSYSGVVVVSIAGAKDRDCSFSADTGMAECLIVAQKTQTDEKRATFVVLSECPASTMAGRSGGEQISRAVLERSIRKLEDGPVGGTTIRFGDDVIGYALDAPLPTEGSWNIARVWDLELAQTAYQVMKMGRVWLPTMPRRAAVPIPVTLIGDVGQVGPHHRDIGEGTLTTTGGFRGPFEVRLVGANRVPTYPVLWSHEAQRERCMQFEAESEGVIRKASSVAGEAETNTKAERIWNSASHCHLNTDFRFNSQSTAMQFSARPTMGGRAWPSIKLANQDQEKALTAWGNTSLGILMHWWHANKQQSGRGSVPITALKALPVLDVTKLSKETLARAVAIFDAMKQRELRPVNEIDRDPARSELDTRLATEVLGFPPELAAQDGPLALLRQKLALEPSINGGKLSS